MAAVSLDRLEQLLRQINASAEETAKVFQRIEQIVGRLSMAEMNRDAEAFKRAAAEARSYDRVLRRLAQGRQQAVAPTTTVPGGRALPPPPAVTPVDKGLLERQRLFNETFGVSNRAIAQASKLLGRYNLDLNDLSRVMIDPITQTKQFTFYTKMADGVISKATIAVDRFGNIVSDSGTRFKGFTDMVGRNIVKVLEWAVAVGVVYGAFSQLTQVIGDMRDFDEIMSDIAITMRETGDTLSRFFESAAIAARDTGVNFREVLGIYDETLRATSAIRDETTRLAASEQLLTGTLQMARLTGMETDEAMDSLLGTLRQLGSSLEDVEGPGDRAAKTFEQTTHLMNVWVYTARDLNVTLDDLATTFAITGAAAAAAGVDIEELTAITAVMAETTVKSADEIGNSIRRMITTMQSETGLKALQELGISLEDMSGNMREWDDIMQEIARRRQAGAISDAAFRQLTYALGGGARGAADVTALIDSYEQVLARVAELRDETLITGAAEAAMAEKSETLNDAINNMTTAFSELVMELGTDGGLLDLLTGAIGLIADLVDGMTTIVDTLGPATIRMAAFGAAMAVVAKYGPYIATALGQTVTGQMFMAGMGKPQQPQQLGLPGFGLQQPQRTTTQRAAGLAPAILYAGMATMGEEQTGQKIARAGTIIGGAIIGELTMGSPLVGAAIGDAIGSVLVKHMERARLAREDIEIMSDEELRQAVEAARAGLEEAIYGTARAGFIDPQRAREEIEELVRIYEEEGEIAAKAFGKQLTGPGLLFDPTTGRFGAEVFLQQLEEIAQVQGEIEERGMASDEAKKRVQLLATERDKNINLALKQIESEKIINDLIRQRRQALIQLSEGEIGKKEFKNLSEAIDTVTESGVVAYEAFRGFEDIPIGDFFARWIEMAPEARDEIMSIVTSINQLEDAIAGADEGAQKGIWQRQLKEMEEQARIFFNLPTMFEGGAEFKFRGFADYGDLTQEEFQKVLEMAREFQQQYLDAIIPEEAHEAYFESLDAWVAYNAEAFGEVEELHQNFVQMAKKAFDEYKKEQGQFNLQRLKDISPQQVPELNRLVRFWENYLTRIPGYEGEAEQFNLILGEEGELHRLVTTQEALRFAIEDLTAVEKKQLEGMWNIPEGATVMVPLQSLYYAPKGGGAGAVPDLPKIFGDLSSELGQPADTMDMAADKMMQAADKMGEVPIHPDVLHGLRQGQEPTTGMGEVPTHPDVLYGITQGQEETKGMQAVEALMRAAEAMQNIQIEVPPIEATFVINNTVTLDGQVVARQTSRRQSRELHRVARGRGYAGGTVIE